MARSISAVSANLIRAPSRPRSLCLGCLGCESVCTAPLRARHYTLQVDKPQPLPFFTPPFRPDGRSFQLDGNDGKGKGKEPGGQKPSDDPEREVDDREWEMRVARGMLHLRETLPMFFHSDYSSARMFPPEIFSQHVVLKVPAPIPMPIKISSLSGYSMAFSIARNGLQALHTDLSAQLERMTLVPTASEDQEGESPSMRSILSHRAVPTNRQRQIRLLISVSGIPRLPPHKEAVWQTSSLYTFSPVSGLIASHEIETIRPLPGEGVAQWLMNSLLGWTSRQNHEGAIPCPRAVAVRSEAVNPSQARLGRRRSE